MSDEFLNIFLSVAAERWVKDEYENVPNTGIVINYFEDEDTIFRYLKKTYPELNITRQIINEFAIRTRRPKAKIERERNDARKAALYTKLEEVLSENYFLNKDITAQVLLDVLHDYVHDRINIKK